MNERWRIGGRAAYSLAYHLVWTPKFRRPVLINGVDGRLKELLEEKAAEHGWVLDELVVAPDHCRFHISAGPTDAPHYIVSQLKAHTSSRLRAEFAWLRTRLPSLWSRSYYIESVGQVSEADVALYIEHQKKGGTSGQDDAEFTE